MKHTTTQLILAALLLNSINAFAQPAITGISGQITDSGAKKVAFATVLLLRASDSLQLRSTISDSLGRFGFEGLEKGTYLVKVSSIGYQERFTRPITIDANTSQVQADITGLMAKGKELENVSVTGRRQPIEVQADRTIVNVEASLSNTGATALEVLEKSPGVTVDRDGNISLRGKPNPLVMIDGKPTYLSPADLVSLLNTMNANQLDQIELMTNPPAKYDAAGNAGVINIKTKKAKQKGFNGSANAAYNQGRYATGNGSLNLNYRNQKFNLFGNYNYNRNNGFGDLTLTRDYVGLDGSTVGRSFYQPSYLRNQGHNHTLKVGTDYYLNKKTTLGFVAGGFNSPRYYHSETTGYWSDADNITDSSTQTLSNNNNRWKNYNLNLNLRHQFNPSSDLAADIDFIRYDMVNNQHFTNRGFDANGNQVAEDELTGYLPSTIKIFSAKADYSFQWNKAIKTETGAKTSFVKTDNLADYRSRVMPNTEWEPNNDISNHFLYEENIAAAYITLKGSLKKWDWQAGLRYEHTNYNGYQAGNEIKPDSAFSNIYNSLFPTAYLTYKADSSNTFTLNAGRRINRPAYQQLNPFKFFINKYTYQEGNPYLQPEFTSTIEFTHSYKGKLNTTLGYAYTKQAFSQVFRPEGGITILTEGNLGSRQNYNLTVNINERPAKWWTLSFTGTLNYLMVESNNYGQVIESSAFNGNANINNQFKFGKGWSAELSGFYNTKSEDGQFIIAGFGQASAGIGKQVLKNKGTIRLNARDIFWTQKIDGHIKYDFVREHFYQYRDSRVVTLSVQYRFGKQMKDGERKRNGGGATDEQNRVRIG